MNSKGRLKKLDFSLSDGLCFRNGWRKLKTDYPSYPFIVIMKHLAIHLKLLGMAAFWGASWPMGRMLGQALPPLTGGMLRFLTAAILLLGWLFARYRLRTLAVLSRKQWLGLALAAAFGVFGFTVLSMLGLQWIPASRATVLVTFNPVLTMFFAALLFGE